MSDAVEEWADICGYEGRYRISTNGNVFSLIYNKMLSPFNCGYGYLNVGLRNNGKTKLFRIHRLVAEAFIKNPNSYPEVNHIDEDKRNNRVDNLEWCNRKYNENYGTKNKKRSVAMSKPVVQLTTDGSFVKKYSSQLEAERTGAFSGAAISACCHGRYKTHKGYIWKFEREAIGGCV